MKKQTLTFGAKIALSTGTLAAVLVGLAWWGLSTIGGLRDSFTKATGPTARKLELAGILNDSESDIAAGQRGVLLYGYAKDAAAAADADRQFQESCGRFQRAIAEIVPLLETEQGKEVVRRLQADFTSRGQMYLEMKRLADSGDLDGATRFLRQTVLPVYVAMGKEAEELATLTDGVLQRDRRAGLDRISSSWWLMMGLIAAGAAAALGSGSITRSATSQLRQLAAEMLEGSRQVAAASGQVASASQSLAQGTSEQAATLEETSSSTTEITAITRSNVDNTQKVAALTADTAKQVEGANHNLEEMVQSMNEINASSEKIFKIIRVIDEIAFQTNILALNAAVEAARAGEAGMGFAVVADEVRSLAHRSAQAAKDTAALIEESIGKSNEGSRKLGLVAKSIQQITGSATQVKTLMDEIAVGSQEQSRGIEQISKAVEQMEQVTQRGAANAEQSASASEELAGQAQGLHAIVEKLRVLVGSGQNADSHPTSPRPRAAVRAGDAAGHVTALGNRLRPEAKSQLRPIPALQQVSSAFPLDESEERF